MGVPNMQNIWVGSNFQFMFSIAPYKVIAKVIVFNLFALSLYLYLFSFLYRFQLLRQQLVPFYHSGRRQYLALFFLSLKKARITFDIMIVGRAITIRREINKRSKVILPKIKQRRLTSIYLYKEQQRKVQYCSRNIEIKLYLFEIVFWGHQYYFR